MSKVKKFADEYKEKGEEQLKKKKFVKKFKKSMDFKTARSSVDSQDQLLAEKTTNPNLIKYLNSHLENYNADVFDIPMEKGLLKISRRDRGLYSGVMVSKSGEVIEKFDEVTVPLLAKNLEMKDLANAEYSEFAENHEEYEPAGEEMAKEYESAEEEYASPKAHVRIKCGDIEIEIKKSIQDFASSFKKANQLDRNLLKSLKSLNKRLNKKNENEVAKALLQDWDTYKEDFMQRLHGIKVVGK